MKRDALRRPARGIVAVLGAVLVVAGAVGAWASFTTVVPGNVAQHLQAASAVIWIVAAILLGVLHRRVRVLLALGSVAAVVVLSWATVAQSDPSDLDAFGDVPMYLLLVIVGLVALAVPRRDPA